MAAPPPIGHIPNITEACASFEHRLDEFRKEAQGGAQFFYAMMAIHGMAGGSDEVYRTIDDAALFWSTNVAALQTAFFVTLGRVFDQCSGNCSPTPCSYFFNRFNSLTVYGKKCGIDIGHVQIDRYR